MKFSISRESLLAPLQQVVSVIERKQTMPILSNVLIRFEDGNLFLTGSDLEVQLVAQTNIDSDDVGKVTLPARKVLDICRLLPDKSVLKFNFRDEKAELSAASSRFNLSTLPAENYPVFDAGSVEIGFQVAAPLLKKALDKTMFAMAAQDYRYYLNGVLLELDGIHLTTVASDGHRLCFFQDKLETATEMEYRQIIVPRKGIAELYRLLGDNTETLSLNLSSNTLLADLGSFSFSSKLIEGRYADYKKVLPKALAHEIRVDRSTLKSALNRVSILSGEKQRSVTLEISQSSSLIIRSQNPEHEDAEETLSVESTGGDITVGFNAAYLLDAVNNIDSDDVKLSLPAGCGSCVIEDTRDNRFLFIVMPMRL